jgi:hypothetical protein
MNTTYYIERVSETLAEGLNENSMLIELGAIYQNYIHDKHVKGVEIVSNEYSHHSRLMDSLDRIFDYFAWQECGLNGDWSVQAYHYGFRRPNLWEGDYYVTDQEDGTFEVVKYYPEKEEDCVKLIKRGFDKLENAKAYAKGHAGIHYHNK